MRQTLKCALMHLMEFASLVHVHERLRQVMENQTESTQHGTIDSENIFYSYWAPLEPS